MKKRKYKVLVISASSPHAKNYLKRIAANDSFDIRFISTDTEFCLEGIPTTIVNFSRKKIKNWIDTPKKIRQVANEFKPDIVHFHQINSVGMFTILALKKSKIPITASAWGSDVLLVPKTSWINRKIVQFCLKNIDVCTSDSEFMGEVIRELSPNKKLKIEICNFGVEETNIPIKKEKIIYSNRNHNPIYRIDLVIEAFSKFSKKHPDWKLIVAGRGSLTDELKQQVSHLKLIDKVDFVGFIAPKDNYKNYAKSTYFISIPKSDATAMSLLEAMYYGCVPILIDLPANKEWVENNVNGTIIQDVNSEFISPSLDLNTEKIAEMNRKMIIEKATVSQSEQQFQNVLFSVIEQ